MPEHFLIGSLNTRPFPRKTQLRLPSIHFLNPHCTGPGIGRPRLATRNAMTMMMFRSLLSQTRINFQFSTSKAACPAVAAAASTCGNRHHQSHTPHPQKLHQYRSIHIEKKLTELKIILPSAPMPKANYNIVCRVPGENIMYVSGHLPISVSTSFTQSKENYMILSFS